jgi:hypothetical protein
MKKTSYIMAGLLLLSESGLANSPELETRRIMAEFLAAIEKVLPLSLQGDTFEMKENQAAITVQLQRLANHAEHLKQHFLKTKSSDYSYIAQSIARDARDVLTLYKGKNFQQARFVVHNISRNCVSCHLKEPATKSFPNPARLFAGLNTAKLSGYDLAHFKVMTRQFDDALKLFEEEFSSQDHINTSAFADYLKVAIRVNLDAVRVTKILKKMPKKNLDSREKETIAQWLSQLDYLQKKNLLQDVSFSNGRNLLMLASGEGDAILHGDRALIYKIATSSVLHRLLNQRKLGKEERAEVYYLLGRSEASLADSFWLSEIENYLEQSIRVYPRSQWAKKAYLLLEEEYILGYTGSSGTNVPEDVRALLTELRELAGIGAKTGRSWPNSLDL